MNIKTAAGACLTMATGRNRYKGEETSMQQAPDPRHLYCARVGQYVRVCRAECDCRAEFGCTKPNCPLEGFFDLQAYDARMKAFATERDLWPVR